MTPPDDDDREPAWQMTGPGDLDVPVPWWPTDAPVPYRVAEGE